MKQKAILLKDIEDKGQPYLKMKKEKFRVFESEFNELRKMGYEVHKFEFWHYRISRYGSEFCIDVFPTTRVYVKKYSGYATKSISYQSLVYMIETELDPLIKKISK